MSQVDSVCSEKTCLSHMLDNSVSVIVQLHTHKVSSFDGCHILNLNSTYD